jgi:hypothetical protein
MARAISVTFSRSLAAPFVTRPKTTSFGGATGEGHDHPVDELLLRVEVAVLLR